MYSRFIQRRGGTIVSLFCCQKTVIIFLENIINPSQHTSRCRNWAISPLAANIYCCLTRCSFVFILNRPYTVQVYSCKKWQLPQPARITQSQNTEFIYAEILNRSSWLWCFRATFFIYIFNLLSSRLHMAYFALFRCVTSYLFYFCS